ncbi:hypothetical protein GCM10025785_10520 [Corynebacterium canis]
MTSPATAPAAPSWTGSVGLFDAPMPHSPNGPRRVIRLDNNHCNNIGSRSIACRNAPAISARCRCRNPLAPSLLAPRRGPKNRANLGASNA